MLRISFPSVAVATAVLVFCTLVSLASGSAQAVEADQASAVRETLMPSDFARFAPRTALDMASQIPGFPIEEGGDDRGFGQADTNVLINNRRISGKSNGPVAALSRIPASDVVRLEILDGASLDIAGLSGQVLNVVTATGGGISGRYRYSPEIRTDEVPVRWGDGEIAVSGGSNQSEWSLSVGNEQRRRGSDGPEFVTDGQNALLDERFERAGEQSDQPSISGLFTLEQNNGNILNLTGGVNWRLFRSEERSERNPINNVARVRELRQTEDEFNFEVGADYEFGLGAGRLKLIGLHRFEDTPSDAMVDTEFADGRPITGSFFKRNAEIAESVVRAEYNFNALAGDWQWSLEGAQNYLDIEAELSVRDAEGTLVDVEFPGASDRVEEDRAEMTLSYGRPLGDKVQLQTSFGAEYSKIRQTGEFSQTRDFVRPKGFVSLNWEASSTTNLSLQIERAVAQLEFFDVIATVNVNQDRVNVTNTELVPPQSWLTELQLQHSLGSYGSLTLSGFYEAISDIVDLIPIDNGAAGIGQAPGNIDSAERLGGALNATLLFDPLGWRGARLDIEANYTDSEVRDPLLGNNRRISDDDYLSYEVRFRQDFPGTTWAAGFGLFYRENTPQVRLDEISLFRQSVAFTRVFIENKDVFGTTFRATLGNLNDRSNDFSRTLFNDRRVNDIATREERFLDFGLLFQLEIEGSF